MFTAYRRNKIVMTKVTDQTRCGPASRFVQQLERAINSQFYRFKRGYKRQVRSRNKCLMTREKVIFEQCREST